MPLAPPSLDIVCLVSLVARALLAFYFHPFSLSFYPPSTKMHNLILVDARKQLKQQREEAAALVAEAAEAKQKAAGSAVCIPFYPSKSSPSPSFSFPRTPCSFSAV
jgi:hypothetical protein